MKKQKVILDVEDILNTYKTTIPQRKFDTLKLRKWLPLLEDSELARESSLLVGKLMGDGNLDNKFTCRFIGQKEELVLLKKILVSHFLINENSAKITYRENVGTSYMLQINDSLLGRFMYALGAPMGNKTKIRYLIPPWIIRSKPMAKRFLQAIFDDELSTIKIKREKFIQEATFRMAKVEEHQDNLTDFLNQLKNMTQNLGVDSSEIGKPYFENIQVDGARSFSQCFRILGNRQNIVRFNSHIGFGINQEKIRQLERCMTLIENI
jgi:hypothetical protein|tara:strand:+ start:287 stop:1084 length:798 start_codon:yes stop_codon:yes gene_type:complete